MKQKGLTRREEFAIQLFAAKIRRLPEIDEQGDTIDYAPEYIERLAREAVQRADLLIEVLDERQIRNTYDFNHCRKCGSELEKSEHVVSCNICQIHWTMAEHIERSREIERSAERAQKRQP